MAFFRCGMGSGKKYDDYKGKTVTAKAVSSDSANTYLTIPKEGIYDETSKICTPNNNLGKELICLGGGTSFKTPDYPIKLRVIAYYIFQSTSQGGTKKFVINTPSGAHAYTLTSNSDTDTKAGRYEETVDCPANTTISISSSYVSGSNNSWVNNFMVWGVGIKK